MKYKQAYINGASKKVRVLIFGGIKKPTALVGLSWGGYRLRLGILLGKLLIRHADVHDELDEGYNGRDKRPAEDQVEKTLQGLAKVKLVNANPTKEESEKGSCDSALAGTIHCTTMRARHRCFVNFFTAPATKNHI
nr:hypothetical protein [Aeromonas veronii]